MVFISLILLVIGFVLLVRGADYFVDGASALAKRMHVPTIVIGLTVVAMGTSAPEASVSIVSALHNSNAIAIGNVIGSNIANILLILGITSLMVVLRVQKRTLYYEIPFTIFITFLLYIIGSHYGRISHSMAWLLLGLFGAFLLYLFITSYKNQDSSEDIKSYSIFKIVLYIILGMIALILGGNLTVDSAVSIANYFGVPQRVIGLTIVALGTSLPELVTSIIAARKGETDIAIGNIIGSNIFNILFVLGLSGVILPIPFDSVFLFDTGIALLAAVLLLLCSFYTGCIGRKTGVLFLITYILYMWYLI